MEQWAMLIKDFDFPLDRLRWFVNIVVNVLGHIHEVNMINFINNLIIMINFEESTLMTIFFRRELNLL